MAGWAARRGARDRRLCPAAAMPRLRGHRRRGSPVLPDLLVFARLSGWPRLRALLDSATGLAARRDHRLRCVSCRAAAVRGCAGGGRLWPGRARGGAAAQIWTADGARAIDGAADGAATGGPGRQRCVAAGTGAAPSLAPLVARVQSGGAGCRRAGEADRRGTRSSSADAGQADGFATREEPARTRAYRRRGVRARARCPPARCGAASRTGRRRPCERRDAARGGAGAAALGRRARFGADLGAGRPRCA